MQILTQLLEKYPDTVDVAGTSGPAAAAAMILKSLSTLLQSTRATSTKRHVLAACLALATAVQKGGDNWQDWADWDVVFRTAFNMISMNQAGQAGHQLFQLLYPAKRSSLLPVDQVYSLYTNHLIKVTPESVGTLSFMLRRFPLRMLAASTSQQQGAIGVGDTPLDSLLVWLFPDSAGSSNSEENTLPERRDRGNPRQFATLLFQLAQNRFQATAEEAAAIPRGGAANLDTLEARLLASSLVTTLVKATSNGSHSSRQAEPPGGIFCNKEALVRITDSLLGDVSHFLDSFDEKTPSVLAALQEVEILLTFEDSCHSDEQQGHQDLTESKAMIVARRLLARSLAATHRLLVGGKTSQEDTLTLLTAWQSFVVAVGGVRSIAILKMLSYPRTGSSSNNISLLGLAKSLDHLLTMIMDRVEAASIARAAAERPAAPASNPFDDFDQMSADTSSSSRHSGGLLAESFESQLSDTTDRIMEAGQMRSLHLAFTILAQVGLSYKQFY